MRTEIAPVLAESSAPIDRMLARVGDALTYWRELQAVRSRRLMRSKGMGLVVTLREYNRATYNVHRLERLKNRLLCQRYGVSVVRQGAGS